MKIILVSLALVLITGLLSVSSDAFVIGYFKKGPTREIRMATEEGSLFIQTERLEVEFNGADLVSLKNWLTGEEYTQESSKLSNGLNRVKIKNSADADLAGGSWEIDFPQRTATYKIHPTEKYPWSYNMVVTVKDSMLVIRCDAAGEKGGVCGITWGINNLTVARSSAVLPVKEGRILSKDTKTTASEDFLYPTYWEAQCAIITGDKGCACIYSTDQTSQFKHLTYNKSDNDYQLLFQTDNPAPFDDLKSAKSVEWRINCYKGDWRTAAAAYKTEMRKLGTLYNQSAVAKKQSWADSIKGAVRIENYKDTRILDELANHVDPHKTLLYFNDWRRDGYDINYPDYTGRPGMAEYIKYAQKLGFRVMLHVDLPGVHASNPAYEKVKQFHCKDAMTHGLMGWVWGQNVPHAFAFINPASTEFRQIFVDAMKGIDRDYHPDAVHLDVSGPMWNDANGLINGMNFCQGSMQLHKELLQALPNLVLSGESVNELLAPYEHFAQRWAWECSLDPHPVCEYLFGDMTTSYGYLGQPNPDKSPASFTQYIRNYEPECVIPSMAVDSMDDMSKDKTGAMRWFNNIRTWQKYDLRPDWSKPWPKNIICQLIGDHGVKAEVLRTQYGVKMTCGKETLYERVEGVTSAKINGWIANHYAYSNDEPFGLDIKGSYWIEAGKQNLTTSHVSALSDGVILDEAKVTDNLVMFKLSRQSGAEGNANAVIDLNTKPLSVIISKKSDSKDAVNVDIQDFKGSALDKLSLNLPCAIYCSYAEPEKVSLPFDLTTVKYDAGLIMDRAYRTGSVFGGGAHQTIAIDGKDYPAISGHPPAMGKTILTWVLALPKESAKFAFTAGIMPKASTNGVAFAVRVNGINQWENTAKSPLWWNQEVDLSAYAGQTIVLDLVTDSLGDEFCDWAEWVQPRIIKAKN